MRIRVLACALLLAPLHTACRREPVTHVTVRGQLVATGRLRAAHTSIMAYKALADTTTAILEVGDSGQVLNPGATTDSLGRFEMVVPVAFLPPNRTIRLTYYRADLLRSSPLRYPNGALLDLVILPGRRLVRVDRIVVAPEPWER